jgi:hypothetical protein
MWDLKRDTECLVRLTFIVVSAPFLVWALLYHHRTLLTGISTSVWEVDCRGKASQVQERVPV